MKKITKIATLILLLSFMVLLCVGCGGGSANEEEAVTDTEFSYSVAYAESYNLAEAGLILGDDASSDGFSTELVKSYADLVSYSTTSALPFYDTGSSEYDSTLSQQVRTYDSAYFEDSALVFVYAYNQINEYIQTVRVEVVGETLNIALSIPAYIYDGTEDELVYVYIVEVSQVGLEDVLNIEVFTVNSGYFYSLSAAETLGLLTAEEFASIAYYFYEGLVYSGEYSDDAAISLDDFVATDYEPIAMDPAELSEETILAIKTTYVDYSNSELDVSGASEYGFGFDIDDISILGYLGTYGDYVAVVCTSIYSRGLASDYKAQLGDTVFYFPQGTVSITLWTLG